LSVEELLLGPQLIEALQSLFSPDFDRVFVAITMLGSDEVLVGLSAVVYWCFDKPRGRLITYILLLGAYLNYFVKLMIPWPRPPVDLRIVEKNETSLGFPSGHAQDSTTFWALLSLNFRRRILAVTGTVVVLMVGISRVCLRSRRLGNVRLAIPSATRQRGQVGAPDALRRRDAGSCRCCCFN